MPAHPPVESCVIFARLPGSVARYGTVRGVRGVVILKGIIDQIPVDATLFQFPLYQAAAARITPLAALAPMTCEIRVVEEPLPEETGHGIFYHSTLKTPAQSFPHLVDRPGLQGQEAKGETAGAVGFVLSRGEIRASWST